MYIFTYISSTRYNIIIYNRLDFYFQESSNVALNQANGNGSVALDLLKSQQRLRIDNLQLQNSDLINGPGRPSKVIRNHGVDQNGTQPHMVVTDNSNAPQQLHQIRSESPAVVLHCNGNSNNIQVIENENSQMPPALPPRSSQKEAPPRIPAHTNSTTTSLLPSSDGQQTSQGVNGHPLIGRKYSPNAPTQALTNGSSVAQSNDAPPLPPPRGAQHPPPTPPPVHPRGTTPPPATSMAITPVPQQLNQGGSICVV